MHFRNTFIPIHWKQLTNEQHLNVLDSYMFLKKKRIDENIKGITVAGRNKQRSYGPKDDASSPTLATESVLLIYSTDAEENRDVAVIEILNAFIQTRVENEKYKAFINI